eukprot:3886825-Pleurochrysis_carterae.AAC.1
MATDAGVHGTNLGMCIKAGRMFMQDMQKHGMVASAVNIGRGGCGAHMSRCAELSRCPPNRSNCMFQVLERAGVSGALQQQT